MFYDRKIKYFDYIENGEKVRSVGFVKLEARDAVCNIALQISGLHMADKVVRKVYLLGADKKCELCELFFEQGKASVQLSLDCADLCGGLSYTELDGISIPLTSEKEILCIIGAKAQRMTSGGKDSGEEQRSQGEEQRLQREAPELKAEGAEPLHTQTEEVPIQHLPEKAEESCVQTERSQEQLMESQERPATVPLLDDKWKQLSAIYTHITPFQDEREYLSLGPGDFVILSQKYYKLVSNSFLLHGYYNYRHLILARMEVRGEIRYYIGVPGNFYEREKQVALMFGFESFECREEPADVGDFGYYMIRVEL